MKDNNFNKDYINYTQSDSENNYPEKQYTNSNPPLPANSYLPVNNNNKIHPVDELNKFNSKPVSQSQLPLNSNKDSPYQAGVYSNNNNNNINNNINNKNSDIPYQAGNMPTPNQMQFQQQQQIPYQQQPQIPYQQQPQIPYQQQPQILYQQPQQQQIPIQQIPIQPQVNYVNPQPVIMTQPNFVAVPNVQYGVCPSCGGSGISFQTGFRCSCVGGPSSGDMLALGMGLGMFGGFHRNYYFP
jgi:hypothetical protein